MSQDNPFAKLGALEQKLYQETTPKPEINNAEEVIKKLVKEKQENTSLLANQQTSKIAKKQTSKPANLQTSETSLSTKEKKKYGTYLREDSILDIQLQALQSKRKDHEVLQEAVDFYFASKKK